MTLITLGAIALHGLIKTLFVGHSLAATAISSSAGTAVIVGGVSHSLCKRSHQKAESGLVGGLLPDRQPVANGAVTSLVAATMAFGVALTPPAVAADHEQIALQASVSPPAAEASDERTGTSVVGPWFAFAEEVEYGAARINLDKPPHLGRVTILKSDTEPNVKLLHGKSARGGLVLVVPDANWPAADMPDASIVKAVAELKRHIELLEVPSYKRAFKELGACAEQVVAVICKWGAESLSVAEWEDLAAAAEAWPLNPIPARRLAAKMALTRQEILKRGASA